MVLKPVANREELLVEIRPLFLKRHHVLAFGALRGLLRGCRSDAGHHVFALGVDQPLAEELVLAGGRVARERDARRGRVAQIAEYHGLDVDGGAPLIRDAFNAAVGDGAAAVPGLEHRADASPQLLVGIVGERLADGLLDDVLELVTKGLEVLGVEVDILHDALALLHGIHGMLELFTHGMAVFRSNAGRLFHDHVGIHHDQAPVRVIGKTLITRLADQPGKGLRAEAQVQHRVHHAGHRTARARADRHQQRVLDVAVFLAHDLLDFRHGLVDLGDEALGQAPFVPIVLCTHLGGDRESRGHGDAQIRHLREIGALAAEEILHLGLAFGLATAEEIYVLFRHLPSPSLLHWEHAILLRARGHSCSTLSQNTTANPSPIAVPSYRGHSGRSDDSILKRTRPVQFPGAHIAPSHTGFT